MTKPDVRPTDLEMQVLTVLWDRGPSTARDVLTRMPDGKARAYTTILSTMQVMARKGLLTHERDGRAYVYTPAVQKRDVVQPMMRTMIDRIFAGNSAQAVQYLLKEGNVSASELAEIRQMLDAERKP